MCALSHMSVVRRALVAGVPESVAKLIAMRLPTKPMAQIEVISDEAFDAIIDEKEETCREYHENGDLVIEYSDGSWIDIPSALRVPMASHEHA